MIDIAEMIEKTNMMELASKTANQVALSEEERDVTAQLDEWAREIGKTGNDKDHEIAAFIEKTINTEIVNAPDELLDGMFDRGTIGEFDDYHAHTEPKNTLRAIEAAKGGNVDRSYIDIRPLTPSWKNRQVETGLSFVDIRRNGWKSVAILTDYAMEALRNAMFYDIFAALDSAIQLGAANYITNASQTLLPAAMDELALYVNDYAQPDSYIVALSKYIQQASKFPGFASDGMKDEVYRTGFLGKYDGIPMRRVSSHATLNSDGTTLLIPDKRVFGVAGKVGALDMRGDVHVYESSDIDDEKVHIKVADFTYGYAFSDAAAEHVAKIVLQ